MAKRYNDDSIAPIIAMDFDGTITRRDSYPEPAPIREYAKEVINFLIAIGVKVVIHTSRDVAINQDTYKVHDDITPMVEFLKRNDVKFSAINKSVQFAPFSYNSRKIYAHMYVDDKGFGWRDTKYTMISVLSDILTKLLGICAQDVEHICSKIERREDVSDDANLIARHVRNFWI